MTLTPSTEHKAHAKYDLLLADIEFRLEQIRNARQDIYWRPWQVFAAMLTGASAFFAAGAGIMALLLRWHP